MRITPDDIFSVRVAQGEIPQYRSVYKFGRVEQFSASDGEVVVWNNGGTYTFPTANGTLSIVSSEAADAVGQGGATEITIQGLIENGSNWEEVEEILTLTGITPVVGTQNFIRVNRMFISKGENRDTIEGANQGKVTATHSDTALPISSITAFKGQTLQAVYTVPSGWNAFILDADANVGRLADATFQLMSRENIIGDEVFRVRGTREAYESEVGQAFKVTSKIEPKTDILFIAKTTATNKNASASFQLLLKQVVGGSI